MDIISLWKAISEAEHPPSYPSLSHDIEVDVAIIGAGITGITAAQYLSDRGKKVAVLEDKRVGEGTTGFSTGNLYIAVQPYYQNIVAKFNLETAKTIALSRQFAIDYIEKNVQEKNINCNFSRRPWYIYTNKNDELSFLEKEVETFRRMEIDIDYTQAMPLPIKFKKAAVMQNQARLNPLKYVQEIAAHLPKEHCSIFENTRVTDIQEAEVCVLKTAQGKVTAKNVIIATHTPIGINLSQLFTAPYRSYVVGVRLKDDDYPEGHFWDLGRPHHAVCTHAISTDSLTPGLLLVAGSHHKTGQNTNTTSHFVELQNYLRNHFPVYDVEYRWSAQHYQSADDVPYIGLAHRSAKHTYIATGYFADGLPYGTLAGMILGDAILKEENKLKDTYNANRFTPLASAGFLTKENFHILLQYLKDQPMLPVKNYEDIKIDQGKVIEINGEKCAVSRDEQNRLLAVSAVCTHMKCIVNWNDAEKTWDCPCHGSRFTREGIVIEGPTTVDLERKKIDES